MPAPISDMSRNVLRHANLFGAGTGFHLDPTQWRGFFSEWGHPAQHPGQGVQAASMAAPHLSRLA
jgi:hypothetical protein